MNDDKELLLEQLYTAFNDRGIPCKRNELEANLQDPVHAQWVADNLRPETLLSKDEADVYARLESSGALQDTLQDPDLSLSSTRPFHDDEIAAAIESLQTSTAAIDAQTGALKSQSQQLRSILMAEKENGIREGKVLGGFRDSNVKESQRINGIVDGLRHDFETDVEKARAVVEDENNALEPRVSSMLKEHDRTLQRCEELAAHHLREDAEIDNEEMVKRVEKLSTKLSGLLAEEIRCRLDRVYLESARESPSDDSDDADDDQPDQLRSIEEEIGSLYSEVDVLAEMYSRQKFQGPVSRTLQRRQELLNVTSGKQLDNILSTMAQLTTSTEQLIDRMQNRQSHRVALNELALTENNTKMHLPSTTTAAESKHRQDVPMKSDDRFPSLTAILKGCDISLPVLLQSSPGAACDMIEAKTRNIIQGIQDDYTATPAVLSRDLKATDKTAQLLASSLHTDYCGDEERPQKLAALETQIDRIRKGVGALDTDSLRGNPEQERFVEQWG